MRKAGKWHFLPSIISVLTLAACFVPYQGGDKGTFTIIIGTPDNSRTALKWAEDVQIEDLIHTIEVSGGPENEQLPLVTVTGAQSVPFTVEPGTWTITVKAYFPEVGDANLKAESFDIVEIKPGKNGAKPITMNKPGDGSEENPFIVYNVETLQRVGKGTGAWAGDWSLSAYYQQAGDITLPPPDASGNNWTPIGTEETPFTGSYDGKSKTISKLTINNTTAKNQGLFGCVSGNGAVVKNVGIVNCDITGGKSVGGVVGGNAGGAVQNCYSTGKVSGNDFCIGGVVGNNGELDVYNGGTVQNCYSACNVSGTSAGVGGVVGQNYNGTVQNCYALGNVSGIAISGTNGDVGGVVGWNGYNGGTVKNCVALNPNVSNTGGSAIGRIAGYQGGSVTNSYGRSDMKKNNDPAEWSSSANGGNGEDITSAEWGKASWWTGTVLFDSTVWDFSGINAAKFPTLKSIPIGAQEPVVKND